MLMALDHRYTQVMLEQVLAHEQTILETLIPVAKDVAVLKAGMEESRADRNLHYSLLRAHEDDIRSHGQRIAALEATD